MLYAIGVVFAFYEFCQRLTNAFDEIDDEFQTFDWYLYPHEIQRMLPTVLMVIQEPVVIECFGSTYGLRDTFKKVNFDISRLFHILILMLLF